MFREKYINSDIVRIRFFISFVKDIFKKLTQKIINEGKASSLKIYTNADKVWVNGRQLSKTQEYFAYAQELVAGRNSVQIRYEMDGERFEFEYFLANCTTQYAVSEMTGANTIGVGSTIAVENDALNIKALSYGGSNSKKLDFFLPMAIDFKEVHNLTFTLQNTCGQQIDFEVYVKGEASNVLVDKVVVFPYETYEYTLNYLYEKAAKAGDGVTAITLRFTNYVKTEGGDLLALPERTLKLYGFKYSLK